MSQRESPAGLLYGASAYAMWGLVPLYWRLITGVPAVALTAHRIVWCALFTAVVVTLRGRLPSVFVTLQDRRVFLTLCLTGALIAMNWGVYIYSIESEQLVEAALGYYINPLISIALGVVLLRERLSGIRCVATALAFVAVIVQTAALGTFPWIALALALSFGFYGYYRKTANIGPLEGVLVEAALLTPVALTVLMLTPVAGGRLVFTGAPMNDALLLLSGPVTALPLVLFSAGARRIRLSTLAFLQYLSPTLTLVLATVFFGEPFTPIHAVSFGCVWLALLLLGFEAPLERLKSARAVR